MVELRVQGLPEDVDSTVAWLRACFVVVDVSETYRNRPPSQLVRVFVKIKAEPPPERQDASGQ